MSIPGTTYASNGAVPVPSTRVTITNTETGKVTQYNLNESSTQSVIDKDGERVFVSTYNIEDKRIMTRDASQTKRDYYENERKENIIHGNFFRVMLIYKK